LSQTPLPLDTSAPVPPSIVEAQVTDVVDGDTIDVLIDGQEYRVRYIGIDPPETVHPTVGEEPYGS
jgi:micrococcal nuclease